MYDAHLLPIFIALKNCRDGGKLKYTMGALPGSLADFLLKNMFLWDKDHDIFSSMCLQTIRSALAKNKHTQEEFNGWIT